MGEDCSIIACLFFLPFLLPSRIFVLVNAERCGKKKGVMRERGSRVSPSSSTIVMWLYVFIGLFPFGLFLGYRSRIEGMLDVVYDIYSMYTCFGSPFLGVTYHVVVVISARSSFWMFFSWPPLVVETPAFEDASRLPVIVLQADGDEYPDLLGASVQAAGRAWWKNQGQRNPLFEKLSICPDSSLLVNIA